MELADLYAAVVPEESYLYRAGLRMGDKILRLDDVGVPAWSTFIERIKRAPDKPHRIDYLASRDNRVRSGTFQMRREEFVADQGQIAKIYVLQVEHWQPLAPEEKVEHPAPIRYAASKALEETFDVTRLISVAFVRLIQGRLSMDSFSGPITIYEVAGEEGRKGVDYFIWVMALLSINLGLLNLLPVPVLDGGQLAFLGIEAVMRRPLPLRVRELSHLVGMCLIILLMTLAFVNDIERRWDVIVNQVKELVG
jgi:regulator of sigma E protease